jgi:hypothetical protein
LLKADEESGNQTYPNAFEHFRRQSNDDLASYVERSRKGAERHRLTLQYIERRLALRDGDVVPEGDLLKSPRFAHLKDKPREDLLALQQQAQRELKRYDDALRIAVTVLGGRAP